MQLFCILCQKPRNKKSMYCSPACRKKMWKIKNREDYLSSAQRYRDKVAASRCEYDPEEKECVVCDTMFAVNKYHPKQACCSSRCSVKLYQSINREKVLKWKRDERQRNKERYAKANALYKDKMRFGGNQMRALNRDKFICQTCAKNNLEVGLVVHHIDFSGQTSKPNNKIENLKTLCRACHIREHTHIVTRSK